VTINPFQSSVTRRINSRRTSAMPVSRLWAIVMGATKTKLTLAGGVWKGQSRYFHPGLEK
jgi:hypothetical protein